MLNMDIIYLEHVLQSDGGNDSADERSIRVRVDP